MTTAPDAASSMTRASVSAGRGPLSDEVTEDDDAVRLVAPDVREGGVERGHVAVDVGEEGERLRHQRSAPAGGMTNEMSASQATSPSTEATARPRPKRRPSFSIVTSSVRRSPGWTIRLKRHSSMPGEEADAVAEALLARDVDRHRLGQRLDLDDPGHDRQGREVAAEEPLARRHRLLGADVAARAVLLDDAVDEQERPAVRDEALDLPVVSSAPPRRALLGLFGSAGASVIGVLALCPIRVRRSADRHRVQERRRALAIEQARREPPAEERLVPQQRPVERDVGLQSVHDELVERDPRSRDGRVAVGTPHDELAEERIVIRRHLVAAVEVALDAHAEPAGRHVALDDADLRAEVGTHVLGVDAELDRVAAQLDVGLACSRAARPRRCGSARRRCRCPTASR